MSKAKAKKGSDPLGEAIGTCKSAFATAGVFSFFVNALILTMPMYMFSLFDRVLGGGNMATLFFLALMALSALFVQALIDIARTYLFVRVSSWIDRQIGEKLLTLSVRLGLPRGNSRSTDLLNRLASLRGFLSGQQVYMMMDAPWIPVFLFVLFLMNTWIGLTAFVISAIMFGLAFLNKVISEPALRRASVSATFAQRTAQSTIENADVVEAMGMGATMRERWSVDNDKALTMQGIASQRAGIIQAFVKMMRMLSMMGVMTVSAIQIMDPTSGLSRGAMMASVILVGRALMPIDSIVSGWDGVVAAISNYKTLKRALQADSGRVEESVTPTDPKGEISVQNVVYHPAGLTYPVLNRVSFNLAPGSVLGIVGPSASGKSTLARLLVGLEKPNFGHVRMDGVDVTTWPSDERGQYVGYLPQDVELFAGTIRENISRFDPDPDKELILDAAQLAGVHTMIQHFKDGYETEIGSGGGLLSGGQRQRVGLARAIYGDMRLIVLDEPNANLDVPGEQALAKAIEALKSRGVTVVVILHRPNILKVCDYILVMRDGMVQKFAARDEVMPMIEDRPGKDKVATDKKVEMLAKQQSS